LASRQHEQPANKNRKLTMRALCLIIILLTLATPAAAQQQPYFLAATVGTGAAQVVPANAARHRITFHNPNTTAKIAICPTLGRTAITCAVGGAGSVTLLPYDRVTFDQPAAAGSSGSVPSPWNAISDTGGSALTIVEFE
jgi:hypothetical protein